MMSRSRPHIHLQGDRKPRRYMHGWDGRTIVTEADEIRLLVTEIQRLEAEGAYLGVIIGGDFNFEPDDPEYLELERAGLRDTYMVASHESEVYSLDPQENLIAGQGTGSALHASRGDEAASGEPAA